MRIFVGLIFGLVIYVFYGFLFIFVIGLTHDGINTFMYPVCLGVGVYIAFRVMPAVGGNKTESSDSDESSSTTENKTETILVDGDALRFSCESCEQVLTFPTREAGTIQSCPHCGNYLDVPRVGASPSGEAPGSSE